MLTYHDNAATIRWAILKKLDAESGVKVCDVLIKPHPDHIAVGILATLSDELIVRSRFDLPSEFDLRHLHNEIDEIAEQYKAARLDFFGRGAIMRDPEKMLEGTGLRGRWPS